MGLELKMKPYAIVLVFEKKDCGKRLGTHG
jgi:hypothetical protein